VPKPCRQQLTWGFAQVWLDKLTSANYKAKLWFGLDKQLWTLVLNFNISFSIGSGSGRTEY
jgi:hypothetical protein